MEIRLHDNSRIRVKWVRPGERLTLELYQPRTMKDGHGLVLVGSLVLRGEELHSLRALIQGRADKDAA